MGSCENLTSVDEPSGDSVSERHLCLETNFDVVDANVNGSMRSDGCLDLSNDDATLCVGSADVGDTGIGNKDGLGCECRNLVGVSLEKVLDDLCGVGRVCSNKNRGEIGVCNSPDRNLGLSRDKKCVSSANITEVIVGDRDGSVSECENVACSVLENLEDDEEQGVCLNESQSEVDGCSAETNGSCLEKRGLRGEDLESFEHWKLSLGEMPNNSSLRNCDRQEKQKGNWGVNLSSVEETVEVMDEETNVLVEVKVDNDNQISSTDDFGMSLESMPVTDLLINCVQQHGQKGENTVSYHTREEGVMIEQSDTLAELEKDHYGQAVPSRCFENPSDLKPVTGSPRFCVQQDEQKDERSARCHTPEGDMDNVEEKTDALDWRKKVTCDQILTSQFCEMASELLPFTGSPRKSVQQDDRENDNNVGCSFSEKTDVLTWVAKVACDQMLPSQCCEMSSEVVSVMGSPRDCVQLGHQENDKNDVPPSSEGLKEKINFVGGIEHDICHPRSPSEHNELPTELVSSTGFSSCYTLQNERKGIESIGYAAVEGKADVAAMEANTCNCTLASRDGEMPLKVYCEDDLLRTHEGHNNQMDHERVGLLAVGNMEPKGNTDTRIISLSMQSCPSSLESLNIADSLSNSSHQTEQGNNRSIYGLSAESVTEAVEEKSDVTTDVKVEVCGQLSLIEETIKVQSSRVVPNSSIEKPVSLQSSQPSAVGENGSSKSLDIINPSQKDDCGAISSSSAVDGFGQMDHGGKDDVGASCFSETNYPNIVSLSSRRISRTIRTSKKTQTKRATRNPRTTAKVQQSHGSIDIIFNVARRKRSYFSKPARSSMWGLWGNITQFFGKSDVSSFSLAQNQGSQKASGGHRSQMRNKVRAGGSSSRSSGKCNVSTRFLRLKVKVGKEICQSILNVVVPKVVDTIGSDDIVVGDDSTDSYPTKNYEFPQLAHEVEETLGAEGTERQLQCFGSNLEDVVKHPDDSVLDIPLSNQDFKAAVIDDKSSGDVADDNPAHKVAEVLGGTSANNYVDPGTSPDSEVINLASDAELRPGNQEGLHKIVLTSSETLTVPGNVKSSRRGKKKTDLLFAGNSSLEDSSPVAASMSKAKPPKKRGGRHKLQDVSHSGDVLSGFPGANRSIHSSSCEEFCGGPLPSSSEAEPGIIGEDMVPSIKSKGCTLSKNLKFDGRKKGSSKVSNSTKSRRKKASTQGGNQRKSVNKNKVKDKSVSAAKRRDTGVFDPVDDKTEDQSQIDDIGKTDSGNKSVCVDVPNVKITSGGELEHYFPPENAWVQCDDCYKWRRIPVSLANSIDKNCRWFCKDNMDTVFADCSIPQEKTNADINAELGLSDYDEVDGLLNYDRSGKGLDSQSIAAQSGSSFRRIDTNVFLHRTRKTQTIDEVMVCHCKPPSDGQFGCGDECLNRMLNIECVQGTCPCGDLCSNQQFQKHKYAKMQWRPCGKKGYGLELLEHIPKGKFIIEYVGEVLDMQAYEARQKEYAANGHKHFYFMTLNGSEVIDACDKGNLGRFINHSCDPNCRTEKWMVNGEICIGLFAMRDIKEGEELTFDYNYVRVFGAAAKKCHCGSPQCRGYIGGDLLNSEIIYQGDSDEEYPEPRMLEDGETEDDFKAISRTCSFYGDRTQISEPTAKDTNKMDYSSKAVGQLEITGKVGDFKNQSTPDVSQLLHSMEMKTGMPISSVHQEVSEEEKMKKTSCQIAQVETSTLAMTSGKSFPDGSDTNRNSKCDIVEHNHGVLKSRPRIKTSRKSGSVKKGIVNGSPLNGNKDKTMGSKSQILLIKPKKIMEGSSNSRFEAVQEKLNELLDAEGGISKRKDAPKGYLKLLLLTAASGGSGNGESIQSNRDLSMILDALLKTKSRVVLMDIINKNGLQMLHNMIKQYRRDFKKIPILRKLLKVLEYLAMREILTQNHIAAGPPCPGMESFRWSILSLTEHDDKQVHQIARCFRDKWIPKAFRKHSHMDRDDSRMDIHRGANFNRLPMLNHRHDQGLRPSEAIDCVMQSSAAATSVYTASNEAGSSPGTVGCQTDGSKTRKRKSRWDQPAKINLDSIKRKELKLELRVLQSREGINCPDRIHNHCNKDEAVSSEDGEQITQEDVPPGFSYPSNPPLVSSDASSTTDPPQQNVSHFSCAFDMAIAQPQAKFNSHLPVSYGIPLHFLQQFGSPQAETVDSWVIAPGMPFQPFPPLPPFPRDKKEIPSAHDVSCKMVNGSAEGWQQDFKRPHNCCPDENNPSTTGANQSDADIPGTQNPFKRMRGTSNDLGKRYFRQQKWKGPPWLWRRNEFRNSYCSQDVSCSVDKPVTNFYQRPPQQNHH